MSDMTPIMFKLSSYGVSSILRFLNDILHLYSGANRFLIIVKLLKVIFTKTVDP